MPPFAIGPKTKANNGTNSKTNNCEISVLAIAKKAGLSFEELNMMTMQDFVDFVYSWVGEDTTADTTQDDIDAFYSI